MSCDEMIEADVVDFDMCKHVTYYCNAYSRKDTKTSLAKCIAIFLFCNTETCSTGILLVCNV
jgi:hypothetical protein